MRIIIQLATHLYALPFRTFYTNFKKYRSKHKSIFIITTNILILLLLISPISENYTFYTKQLLYGSLDVNRIYNQSLETIFEKKIEGKKIIYFNKPSPDFHTIVINGQIKQKNEFSKLMVQISKLKAVPRNIKIILHTQQHRETRIKSFLTINLDINERNILKYDLLDRCTPNSDVFFFLMEFFDVEYQFKLQHLYRKFKDVVQNTINIEIKNDQESLKEFSTILRHLMNLESHSLGSYYYLPSKGGHRALLNISIIILFVFLNEFDQLEKRFRIFFVDLLLIFISFYWPVVLFMMWKNKGWAVIFTSCYFIVFSFNWGLVFIFGLWIIQIFTFLWTFITRKSKSA